MKLKKGHAELLAEAAAVVNKVSLVEAKSRLDEGNTLFVDLRDVRELDREGMIPEAFHTPRGMLEFWVDPSCKYFKTEFATDKAILLYCNSGWRSALSAKSLLDMGAENVVHMEGGFSAWRKAGLPVVERKKKSSI